MKEFKKIITIWEVEVKGKWTHNHISDGYDPELVSPKAVSKFQEKTMEK